MNILGNIAWLVFGGIMVGLEYVMAGVLLCCTIIGIPFGLQLFKLGGLTMWPFGYKSSPAGNSGGCLSTIMNIVWIFTGGIIVALTHLFWGVLLCVTIIGIPFGLQHFKLMTLAFTPFGRDIVAS